MLRGPIKVYDGGRESDSRIIFMCHLIKYKKGQTNAKIAVSEAERIMAGGLSYQEREEH